MSAVLSDKYAKSLGDALGIPIENCTGMVISLEAGEPVRVRATYNIDGTAMDKVMVLVSKLEVQDADNSE